MANEIREQLTLVPLARMEAKGTFSHATAKGLLSGMDLFVAQYAPAQLSWTLNVQNPQGNYESKAEGAQAGAGNFSKSGRSMQLQFVIDAMEDYYTKGSSNTAYARDGVKSSVSILEAFAFRSKTPDFILLVSWGAKAILSRQFDPSKDADMSAFSGDVPEGEASGGSKKISDHATSFFGKLESLQVTYNQFAADGSPLRANVSLTLSEYKQG